jgi:glucokinase
MAARRLVADIGGTNARFALHDPSTDLLERLQVLAAADYPDIDTAIDTYLASAGAAHVSEACFAVACPARDDEISFTNSSWRFSSNAMRRRLGLERFVTVNDFEALALSVPHIPTDALHCVRPGDADPTAPKAIIGPGTGLGVAGLIPVDSKAGGRHWVAVAGEGGHASFAPTDELEIELLRHLSRDRERVSTERVLSGQGLTELFEFLTSRGGLQGRRLPPAEITALGLGGADPTARAALDWFCGLLGSVAGDVALTFGARGGVYIGGGIMPRLLSVLADSAFVPRFLAKGRLSRMLTPIPVFVILDPCASLRGAASVLQRE